MAVVPGAIPVRLVAVLGDAELPEGAAEVGTLSLPVTVTESLNRGEVWLDLSPDVSVFERLADFLAEDEGRSH